MLAWRRPDIACWCRSDEAIGTDGSLPRHAAPLCQDLCVSRGKTSLPPSLLIENRRRYLLFYSFGDAFINQAFALWSSRSTFFIRRCILQRTFPSDAMLIHSKSSGIASAVVHFSLPFNIKTGPCNQESVFTATNFWVYTIHRWKWIVESTIEDSNVEFLEEFFLEFCIFISFKWDVL